METVIACRLCRTPLLHEGGCDTCRGWKRNLVVVGDLPEENVDLGELTGEALKMMRSHMRRLQSAVAQPGLPLGEQLAFTRAIQDFGRALAPVIAEARKVRKEGANALKSSSFQEQVELFVAWVLSLPPAHRRRVADQVDQALGTMEQRALVPGTEEEDDDV